MEYKLSFKDYNNALKKNILLGQKCHDCGTITCPPSMVCQECCSLNMEIVQMSGKGEIVTFTTSFIAPEGRECEAPYTIVLVKLEEGSWIMGNLNEMDSTQIGMNIIGKKVMLQNKVFPGDKYSNGDAARPLFIFVD